MEVAQCGGAFKDEVRELTDAEAFVEAAAANRNAIGNAGIGFRAEGMKPLALASSPSYIDGYEADKYQIRTLRGAICGACAALIRFPGFSIFRSTVPGGRGVRSA